MRDRGDSPTTKVLGAREIDSAEAPWRIYLYCVQAVGTVWVNSLILSEDSLAPSL